MCTKEQVEFGWALTWLGDSGMPVLAEDKAQGCSPRYLGPPRFIPLLVWYFVLSFLPLI